MIGTLLGLSLIVGFFGICFARSEMAASDALREENKELRKRVRDLTEEMVDLKNK